MTTVTPCQQKTEYPLRPTAQVAADLTRGGDQAWIEQSGQIAVLRITRAGKLILTKQDKKL
jgi:hemin uptake protein HemP